MSTRKIETEIVLGGEKDFNRAMTEVNSNLKNLRSDMNAVTAEFDGNEKGVEALTAKQKVLDDTVAQQAAKVDALRQRYDHLAKTTGENSAATDKARQAMNAAIVAQQKAAKAARENQQALDAAAKAANTYTPVTQRAANAVTQFTGRVKGMVSDVAEGAHQVPGLGEALDVVSVAAKGARGAVHAAGTAVKGMGTATVAAGKAAAAGAKELASLTAGAAKLFAALTAAAGTVGTVAIGSMVSFAKEAADAAKAAADAGEPLTESQQKWLAYSESLSTLDAATASAKAALGGVLLPVLGDLSTQGAEFLNGFAADMEAAGNDTAAQTQVITDYLRKGAQMIKEQLPEYASAAKDILSALTEGLADASPDLIDIGLDLVMELLDGVVSASPKMTEGAVKVLNKLVAGLGDRAPELTKAALSMIEVLLSGLTQGGPSMVDGARDIVLALLQGLAEEGPELLDMGMDLMEELLNGIIDSAPEIGASALTLIQSLMQGLTERGPDLVTSAVQMVSDLVSGLAQASPQLIPAAVQLVGQLLTSLVGAAPQLMEAGIELVFGIISGIVNSLGNIAESVDQIVSTFGEALSNSDNKFLAFGGNMIKGIWNGIKNTTQWLYRKLTEWVTDVVQWLKDKLGIKSPSKVMADEVGYWMARGIGAGFVSEMPNVHDQMDDAIDTSFDVPNLGTNRRGRSIAVKGAGGKVVNLTIYTQRLTDADIEMLLELVNRKFGEAV
nr:MAG TPA: tail tape measure protein [Caudoviricetes sp.]